MADSHGPEKAGYAAGVRRKGRDSPIGGHPLALDPEAASASDSLPAFLARPRGAPVYHGFPILDGTEVEGFRLGMISDWETEGDATNGDAFVVAPDGSRAGLAWDIGERAQVEAISPPEPNRWGVWAVTLPGPMRTRDDARRNLAAVLPLLRPHWDDWRSQQDGHAAE